MKHELRIVTIWLVACLILRASLIFPHRDIGDVGIVNAGLQLLLFILSIQIAKNCDSQQRYVFINFSVFFGFTLLLFATVFVGYSLFPGSLSAGAIYHVYVNKIGLNFTLLFALVFLSVEYYRPYWRAGRKYLITTTSTLALLAVFFYPYLFDPLHGRVEREYVAICKLTSAHSNFVKEFGREPVANDLADTLIAASSANGNTLFRTKHDAVELVEDLVPYLKAGGVITIFWKPLDLKSIYVDGIVITLIVVILISLYRQNKPFGAYNDKILLLFLIFCSVEMFDTYGSTQSSSSENYKWIYEIGQYVGIMSFLIMVYTFDLKLRFVLSVTGKYYERVLHEAPAKITRWRDEIDTFILKTFFKQTAITRQLGHFVELQHPTTTEENHEY